MAFVVGVEIFFNVKIKRKETKNTIALETEALSISSVLKMISLPTKLLL